MEQDKPAKIKVAVVSGGSKGLGYGIVRGLLDSGEYSVATFSRRSTLDMEALSHAFPEKFCFRELSLGDKDAVKGWVDEIHTRFGAVNVLINNAAIAGEGVLPLVDDKVIEQLIDVNLKGTIYLTKQCIRKMLIQRHGRIINISSIVASRGYRGLSVYAATKAALEGMTRSLARELGGKSILVNSIAPGYLSTEMSAGISEAELGQIVRRTPLGRLGTVTDVVGLVLFLCSEQASFITGQTLVVDGGLTT